MNKDLCWIPDKLQTHSKVRLIFEVQQCRMQKRQGKISYGLIDLSPVTKFEEQSTKSSKGQ